MIQNPPTAHHNFVDDNIEEIRREFKLLDHWVYLNAGDQMIPGKYWLDATRDFYSFVEFGRMEDIPTADIATHPFLLPVWDECIERAARLINGDKDEVTNAYRPAITANLIFYRASLLIKKFSIIKISTVPQGKQ